MNVVFLGPTLPREVAAGTVDAVLLPPARRGDLLAVIEAHRPTTIAIVDGYFEQVPAVWHKEILFALAQGITVAGAASMGALRAAELDAFGMIGCGRVFEAYKCGRFAPFAGPFEDDDEVAVAHGPGELGYPSTDAMVDIRATLAAAVEAGVIDMAAAEALAGIAKALFYKDRTYTRLFGQAAAAGLETGPLAAWLPAGKVAQKRRDAMDLLARMAQGELRAEPPVFRFERTLHFEAFRGVGS